MPDEVARAYSNFLEAMYSPENLIEIHKSVKAGPGRRTREMALNQAVVVLTVAAWQAFVQDLTQDLLGSMKPLAANFEEQRHLIAAQAQFRMVKSFVSREVGSFSTPNAENSRRMLQSVGFDPRPYWHWWAGPREWTPPLVAQAMNEWLSVRHAIAHGDDLPDTELLPRLMNGSRSLRRENAEACMSFFQNVVEHTTDAAFKDILVF